MAVALGVRHGLDADHLAAIDCLTRLGATKQRPALQGAGILFSVGHGAVVMVAAIAVAALAHTWQAPSWLKNAGAWISVAMLLLLASLNIAAILRNPDPGLFAGRDIGWRMRLATGFFSVSPGLTASAIGALFALSYDTIAIAALFGMNAVRSGGAHLVLPLVAGFLTGMLVTGGLYGLWVAKLVARADHTTQVASRVMALAIAGISVLTAALGVATQLLPPSHSLVTHQAVWWGGSIPIILIASYLAGQYMSRLVSSAPAAAASLLSQLR